MAVEANEPSGKELYAEFSGTDAGGVAVDAEKEAANAGWRFSSCVLGAKNVGQRMCTGRVASARPP